MICYQYEVGEVNFYKKLVYLINSNDIILTITKLLKIGTDLQQGINSD